MDPVAIGDYETIVLKRRINLALRELDPTLSFHDFRIIHSDEDKKKLAFDVVVPYKYDLSDEEIIEYLKKNISGQGAPMECEITVDKEKKAE